MDIDMLESQVLETWRVNNQINLMILQTIPDQALSATLSTHGGRGIAGQFTHMYMTRVNRLAAFSKKIGEVMIQYGKKEAPSREQLLAAFEQSGRVMTEYLRDCLELDGKVPNFKRGLIPMLGYFISHEAHHRGSILLTMKQSGFPLPESLRWGIWEWNKI